MRPLSTSVALPRFGPDANGAPAVWCEVSRLHYTVFDPPFMEQSGRRALFFFSSLREGDYELTPLPPHLLLSAFTLLQPIPRGGADSHWTAIRPTGYLGEYACSSVVGHCSSGAWQRTVANAALQSQCALLSKKRNLN